MAAGNVLLYENKVRVMSPLLCQQINSGNISKYVNLHTHTSDNTPEYDGTQ